jgi:hypothetical protein
MNSYFKESIYLPYYIAFHCRLKSHYYPRLLNTEQMLGRIWLRYKAISLLPPNSSFAEGIDGGLLVNMTLCLGLI